MKRLKIAALGAVVLAGLLAVAVLPGRNQERIPDIPSAADSAAIRATAADYIEGWYEGDTIRMSRAVHPELVKRIVRPNEDGALLQQMGAAELLGNTGAGHGTSTPIEDRRGEIRILDAFQNAAVVRVDAHGWVDYLQMARWNGQWKIVNILWEARR